MRYEKAVFINFLNNLVIQGCNVVTGILTARLLLPLGRGELAAVILWPSILAAVGIFGTNWALTREAAARPHKAADLARTAVVFGLILAAIFMFLGYILIPRLLPVDKHHLIGLTRVYLLFLPLNFIGLNLIALDHGTMLWGRYNLLRLSVVLPYLIFVLIFWIARVTEIWWFVLALLLSNLFTVVIGMGLQWRKIITGRTHFKEFLHILYNALPFFIAAVSGVVAQQIDKAIVVSLLSTEMVGFYAVAFTFASAHASLGGALGVTSFAALANESDSVRQGQYLALFFRQATLLYIGAGAGMALLATRLIIPLFGPDFAPAVTPATILALATSLVSLGTILNEGLRGRGNAYPGIMAQFLGGGVVALAAWHLVPRYGIAGMAWAVVLGGLCQLLILIALTAFLFQLRLSYLWGLRLGELKALYGRLLSVLPFGM